MLDVWICYTYIVSIVVPFWGLPFRILNMELVKSKKGATMETVGSASKRSKLGFRNEDLGS